MAGGFEAFAESVQLLRDDEAKVPKSGQYKPQAFANLASYYDMLSDRLGSNAAWQERSAAVWYAPLAALHPYRMTDSVAMVLYEAALETETGKELKAFGNPTVNLQLGRLRHQAGLPKAACAPCTTPYRYILRLKPSRNGGGDAEDHIAGVHIQFSRAYEAEGRLAEALRERASTRSNSERVVLKAST